MYAVTSEGEQVTFEWLIPWTTATMQAHTGDLRTVAVYFDRVIAATGQRFAYPGAGMSQPRFVSDFARIEIPQYRQQLLAVTPYAVASHDLVDAQSATKFGADLFWKPSASHQFAATLNPDFGQIESDDLVVNFSAIETFFTDKRPFFIDNQSVFDGSMPGAAMFYTRRVGGAADDGSGASDINAAIKASGSVGSFGYGAFMASEDEAAGRDFRSAARQLRQRHARCALDPILRRPAGPRSRCCGDRRARTLAPDLDLGGRCRERTQRH